MEHKYLLLIPFFQTFIEQHVVFHMFLDALIYLFQIAILSYIMVFAVLDIYYSIVRKKFLRKTYIFQKKFGRSPWVLIGLAMLIALDAAVDYFSFSSKMLELHPIIAGFVYSCLYKIFLLVLCMYLVVVFIWFVRGCFRTLYRLNLWLVEHDID